MDDDAINLSATGINEDQMKSMVELVRSGMKICVVYNPAQLTGNAVYMLKHLLTVISNIPTIECGAIPAASHTNAVGAMDMGILPNFYPVESLFLMREKSNRFGEEYST